MNLRSPRPPGARPDEGFSLLELLIVLVLTAVTTGLGVMGYRSYQESTSARRAAEVFVMDLNLARSAAARERRSVAIVFDEAGLVYRIRTHEDAGGGSGRVVRVRDFSTDGEIPLGAISLDLDGDSVAFDGRGVADISGAGGPVARARFEAGGGRYEVRFNTLGTARIDPF